MAIVRISEVDIDFPVVGFSPKHGALWFGDISLLTRCSIIDVEDGALIGMDMFDNRMRRWIVRSLDLKEVPKPIRWWQIFAQRPYVDFELNLEEKKTITFAALKRRLLSEMDIEDPEDRKAFHAARDLAGICEATYEQATGLL